MDEADSAWNVSETAFWTAEYRARETENRRPLFQDRYARRLAGRRGEEIARTLPFADKYSWSWAVRTYMFDELITEQVRQGTDIVVNLAAGLDARPYRMELPDTLIWVEVDLPDIIAYKADVLRREKPSCALERVSLDLADVEGRRALFAALGTRARKALILSEGFVIYMTAEQAGALAADLATPDSFQSWMLDLVSPGLLRILQQNMGSQLSSGGCSLQFGPSEGPGCFASKGWRPTEVRSLLRTAASKQRLPLAIRFLALLPESTGPQGALPWSGVTLLARTR